MLLFYLRLALYHCQIQQNTCIFVYISFYCQTTPSVSGLNHYHCHNILTDFTLPPKTWQIHCTCWAEKTNTYHKDLANYPNYCEVLAAVSVDIVARGRGGEGVVDKSRLSRGGRPHYSYLPLSSLTYSVGWGSYQKQFSLWRGGWASDFMLLELPQTKRTLWDFLSCLNSKSP